MTGIPIIAAISILHDMKYSPLDQAYARAYASVQEAHKREVRAGMVRTLMGIFCTRAIQVREDCIYLFSEYALE